MTLPCLPNDCIYDILNLLKNDRSTLYNCLFVSRFWCKETVPLLYTHPFDKYEKYGKKHNLIIWTFILCFNETEASQLQDLLCVEPYNIQNISGQRPLFEYLRYVENIDSVKIVELVVNWIFDVTRVYYYKNFDIFTIFYHAMMRQCVNIKSLNITPSYFLKNNDEIINLFTFNLSRLNSLKLNVDISENHLHVLEFLQGISKNCLNISKLEIINSHSLPLESLCLIIQNQHHLKAFKLLDNKSLFNDIFLSLEFQKKSLDFIGFESVDFSNISFNHFINLLNLKYLEFSNCKEMLLDQCEVLKFVTFKLKELKFRQNAWDDDITLSIIKYLGESLQRLSLFERLTVPIIENILIYCSNLITLEIYIYSNVELLLINLLKDLRIRILNLTFMDNNNDVETIINLANNIPTSVKQISIRSNLYDNDKVLHFEELLENFHDHLEIINLDYSINLEFLKVLLNYIERNDDHVLKIFGARLKSDWSDDEMILLDKIKDKGVNMVEFNSIYKESDYKL